MHCCTASGCLAADSLNVEKLLRQAVVDRNLGDRVQVVGVGCLGLCGRGPLVGDRPLPGDAGDFYEKVTPAAAPSIIAAPRRRFGGAGHGGPAPPLLHVADEKLSARRAAGSTRSASKSTSPRAATRALERGALTEMVASADVVKVVGDSGLRGRGGAG